MSKVYIYTDNDKEFFIYLYSIIPNTMRLLSPSTREMAEIYTNFQKRIETIIKYQQDTDFKSIEPTMYDWVIAAKNKNIHAYEFLKFIDMQCNVIIDKVSIEIQKRIKKTIIKLFNDFNDTESGSMCFVGELSFLSKIVKENNLVIKEIEFKLNNEKTIDFVFEKDGAKIYTEIVNIRKFDKERINSQVDLTKYLDYQIQKKIDSKIKNANTEFEFSLVVILWGDILGMSKYARFFKEYHNKYSFLMPIMMVAQYADPITLYPKYHFVPVYSYLESDKNIELGKT